MTDGKPRRYYSERSMRNRDHEWLIFDRHLNEKIAVAYESDIALKIVEAMNGDA